MADMNAMTRIVGNKRVPCIVIDKETGERLHRHAIDAKEMVGNGRGRYVWADDVEGVTITDIKLDKNGNPIALVDVVDPAASATPVVDGELTPVVDDGEPEIEDAEPAGEDASNDPPQLQTQAAAKPTKGAKKATKGTRK